MRLFLQHDLEGGLLVHGLIDTFLGPARHHRCQDYNVLELLIDDLVDHAHCHTELVMPCADPALISIEPDIVIWGIWVTCNSSEDEFLPVATHRVGETAGFRDVVGRQLK